MALGLYVVMLSVTGSALVYRNELDRFFATPRPTFDPKATRLTTEQLQARAESLYPGWTVTRVGDRITRRNPTIEIWVERGTEKKERLFNPYTGEDLGDSVTQGEYFVLWLARLHDELLLDRPGRYWNGIGSAVFSVSVHHRSRGLVARLRAGGSGAWGSSGAPAGAASTGTCTARSASGCFSSC